jgi:hypothetical protein
MNAFLSTLKSRSIVLYQFGFGCLVGCVVCIGLALTTTQQVMGVNAFIKPAKFFVSIWVFAWTMGWYVGLLQQQRAARIYAWVVVIGMVIELSIVLWQASQGQLSHFNISSPINGLLFSIMGIIITLITLWNAYIGYLFMVQRPDGLSASYLWAIRLGILVFVLFSFQGFMMAGRLAHTVGAPDGGPGLPVLNWSTRYGDLRIAHFFGMHALQLIPLFGYYIARQPRHVILASAIYVVLLTGLLMQALAGKPLLATLGH